MASEKFVKMLATEAEKYCLSAAVTTDRVGWPDEVEGLTSDLQPYVTFLTS